jgi:hypothetical protein
MYCSPVLFCVAVGHICVSRFMNKRVPKLVPAQTEYLFCSIYFRYAFVQLHRSSVLVQ